MNNVSTAQSSFLDGFIYGWGIYAAIFVVSVIALTIILERLYYYYKKARPVDSLWLASLKTLLSEKRYDEALALAKQGGSPAAVVIQVGIERLLAGSKLVTEEMQQAGNEQVNLLERYLSGLATIATISPLLGILGTVLGMIRAFSFYSTGANKLQMMGGINVALITTALGLIIAIPAYIFYNFLVRRMNEKVVEMEGAVTQVQELLSDKKKGR